MKRLIFISSLLILCLLVAACGPSPEEIAQQTAAAKTAEALTWTPTPQPTATPVPYDLQIDVVDAEGNSIPDAKIITDEVFFTDANGIWETSMTEPDFSASVWAQGYSLQEITTSLDRGENSLQIQLEIDPNGLQLADLEKEGYELIFVEDFQDNLVDCNLVGNGGLTSDEITTGNNLLLVDLRNLNDTFGTEFGPTGIKNAIIEADFRYPDIQFYDYEGDDYNWQGYVIYFRDGFDVEGYPLRVSWGPTLQIRDYSGDEWTFPVTARQTIENNRWYNFSTNWEDSKVEVFINGSRRFTYLNAPETTNSEPAGIGAFGQAYIEFDNIKMWVPVD